MGWFGDKTHYSRADSLEKAERARGKGKKSKAIDEYRKVLVHEPTNAAILAKVGVLLAETRQMPASWKSFVAAAESYAKQGFVEKQYATYRQAAGFMPLEVELWETLARLDVGRERRPDAVKVLLEGRSHFKSRALRGFAIQLLKKAVEIEPWHYDGTLDLAVLQRKNGDAYSSRKLLEGLVERCRGRKLRRVRASLFRLNPTPASAWRWLRAALRGT